MSDAFFSWLDRTTADARATPLGARMVAAGYGIDHTGGGCLAWAKTNAAGDCVWITYNDGISLLPEGDETAEAAQWLVGLYLNNSDDEPQVAEVIGISAALQQAETMLAVAP